MKTMIMQPIHKVEAKITLKEATESKGGVNSKPTTPPPQEPPKGQGDNYK
jgi:hypothetical protein